MEIRLILNVVVLNLVEVGEVVLEEEARLEAGEEEEVL